MNARLSADIGGTFTDLVLLDAEGRLHVEKTSSTPGEFKQGVLTGVDKILKTVLSNTDGKLDINLSDVDHFVHGATVVLNALIERKLPPTALVTTAGFRDVLEIMRTNNPYMYDLKWVKPKPLIPRNLRFEVKERVRHTGEVWEKLDEEGTRKLSRKIKNLNINTVAVCFLHSYANPAHEKRFCEVFLEEHPSCVMVRSSDVAPEIREFERTSTAVINASTVPIITSYLDELNNDLSQRGLSRELYVMQSNGGIISAITARDYPARTVMSGPSGGVVGAQFLANKAGLDNVVTIDMGGTSSDMGVISNGQALTVDESRVDGWPIMAPMIEILAIGAGGGSIAWIDSGGALRVGPQSAGAKPGPVCYRRGGKEPTVSDASVVLNRLNPDYFLGGEMTLDSEGAYRAIQEKIAQPLDMSVHEAAEGIIKIVTANMAKAMRSILIARGHDPRDFTLMAFGGAGGMVAGDLLRTGEVHRVMVPNNPGALCAIGMLSTDFRRDFAQSQVQPFSEVDWMALAGQFAKLRDQGFASLDKEGIQKSDVEILCVIDVRYVGQDHYLRVYVDRDNLDSAIIQADFNELHQKTYGYATPEFDVEMVNLRVFAIGKIGIPELPEYRERLSNGGLTPKTRRPLHFDGKEVETDVYAVETLIGGDTLDGPCIIEDPRSTIVIMPEQKAIVDAFRNVTITNKNS
jgi:N-methylhydantoinase A